MLRNTIWILVISACLFPITIADIFPECELTDKQFLSSNKSCSTYILCAGDESFEEDCEIEAPYFSEIDQTCDEDPSVCRNFTASSVAPISDGTNTVVASTPSPSPSAATSSVSSSTVSSSTVSSSTASSSSLPSSALPSSTLSSSTLSSSTQIPISSSSSNPILVSTTTVATNIASECPAVDDPSKIVFLPHSTTCSDYYMCYHGESLPMHCSNMLHFNMNTQKCDYPENAHCQMDSGMPREKCQAHTVDVYPFPLNCNYYYLCQHGYLMVMQCPINMHWDCERRTCILREFAKCCQ